MKIDDHLPLAARVLQALAQIDEERLAPNEARRVMDGIQRELAGARVDLESEREDYARAWHYDAYVQLAGGGTLVLSLCPDRGLPFMARAAYRWAEDDLVRVNGATLTIQTAIGHLDVAHDPTMTRRLVDAMLLAEEERAYEGADLAVTDEELALGMTAFRKERGLLTVKATAAWAAERGMTLAALETHVEDQVRTSKLRDRIVEPRLAAWFAAHAAELETVVAAHVVFEDPDAAEAFAAQAPSGQRSFVERGAFAVARGEARAADVRRVRRADLEPSVAAMLEGADVGVPVGPVESSRGYEVVQVLAREPATADDAGTVDVRDRVLRSWLDEARGRARIEWFWGTADGGNG